MTTVQQHELTNYLPLATNEDSDNKTLLSTSEAPAISSSIPMQPSRWKTTGKLFFLSMLDL